jgi:hypothetical protein
MRVLCEPPALLRRHTIQSGREECRRDKPGGSLCRRGMTLLEVGVALVVLAGAMLALAQLVGLTVRQRRLADQRSIALQEVANEAERLAVAPWDGLAPDQLTSWKPSAELAAMLPAADCRVQVQDEPGPPVARRVKLRVAWTNAVNEEVMPVELTFWRYAEETRP